MSNTIVVLTQTEARQLPRSVNIYTSNRTQGIIGRHQLPRGADWVTPRPRCGHANKQESIVADLVYHIST